MTILTENFSGYIICEKLVTTTQDETYSGKMVQLFLKLDFPKTKRKPIKNGGRSVVARIDTEGKR